MACLPETSAQDPPKRKRGRPRKNLLPQTFFRETDCEGTEIFLTGKEQADAALAIQLRGEGKITTSGELFEGSTQREIDSLIARGVFEFVRLDKQEH